MLKAGINIPGLKFTEVGNNNIMLTEPGNIFGYRDMVVDFRNIVNSF